MKCVKHFTLNMGIDDASVRCFTAQDTDKACDELEQLEDKLANAYDSVLYYLDRGLARMAIIRPCDDSYRKVTLLTPSVRPGEKKYQMTYFNLCGRSLLPVCHDQVDSGRDISYDNVTVYLVA